MENKQNGTLILYSSLLTPGATNKYGTANLTNTDFTFFNINIRQIMGSNYDKYDKFNIVLNSMIIPTTAVAITPDAALNVMIYMYGVPFDTGSTYSTVFGNSTTYSYIGTVRMVGNAALTPNATITSVNTSQIITLPPTFYSTIIKSQDVCSISIALRSSIATVVGGNPSFGTIFQLPTGVVYPLTTFTFSITPVIETDLSAFPNNDYTQNMDYKQRLFKS
jgi:hypothetical protein